MFKKKKKEDRIGEAYRKKKGEGKFYNNLNNTVEMPYNTVFSLPHGIN